MKYIKYMNYICCNFTSGIHSVVLLRYMSACCMHYCSASAESLLHAREHITEESVKMWFSQQILNQILDQIRCQQ